MSPYHTQAFGLNLECDANLIGCPSQPWVRAQPVFRLRVVDTAELTERWESLGASRARRVRTLTHIPGLIVEASEHGYRVTWEEWGDFVLSHDGWIHSSFARTSRTEWERLAVAQILPLAAVVAGREVLHASAVVIAGRAIGLVGPSGAGKSTVAAQMVDDGATFLTDDVLALSAEGASVEAHPGPRLLRLAPGPLTEGAGPPDATGKVQLDPPTQSAAMRLSGLYFLERSTQIKGVCIGTPVNARRLLAATFNQIVQTPERLRHQLELMALIAAGRRAVRAAFPADCSPREIGALVAEHARSSPSD